MSTLLSVATGVALLTISVGGWIWASLQGGLDTAVLQRPAPWPSVILGFYFLAVLGPSLFCIYYPAYNGWRKHKNVLLRIILLLGVLIVLGVDVLLLKGYVDWIRSGG